MGLAADDAGHAGAHHRNQLEIASAVGRIGQERANAVRLAALDVQQEHVRRLFRDLNRELVEQRRLQRPDADDEKGAEADGQQDDARLIPRSRQMQDGVAQRERPRIRERRDQRARAPGRPACSTTARPAKPAQTISPTLQRRRLPRRDGDQTRGHDDEHGDAQPVPVGAGRLRRATAATA